MSAVAIESSISLHHPHTAERSLNIEEALGMIVWLASVGL
jgi:hemolysin-activating ACP:hemolysin acyltransferase